MTRVVLALLGIVAAAAAAGPATAHETRPAYLEIRREAGDAYAVLWRVPASTGTRPEVVLRLPPECAEAGPVRAGLEGDAWVERRRVRCPGGWEGKRIAVEGLGEAAPEAVVRLVGEGGEPQVVRLTPGAPSFVARAVPDRWEAALAWARAGAEHLLLGRDHLWLPLGFLLLASRLGALARAWLGLAAAQAVALAVVLAGAQPLPSAASAAAAAALAFLGAEAVRAATGRPGTAARRPALAAFLLGLPQSLAFAAGAAVAAGPGAQALGPVVAWFAGLEAAQAALVAAGWLVVSSLARMETEWPRWAAAAPGCLLGCAGAYWAVERAWPALRR